MSHVCLINLKAMATSLVKKILTPGEYVKYSAIKLKHQKAQYLAKCWAVKEAFVKALGTGFTKDYSWSTIEYFFKLGHTGPQDPK